MSLAEKLKTPKSKQFRCSFYDWKITLEPADREAVERVLDDLSYTIEELVRIFAEEGCPVRHNRIRAHRAHSCMTCDH